MIPPRLTRAVLPKAANQQDRQPRKRVVHLGLGAFHRAHQAWYTQHAADADQWGISAFASRSAVLAETLAEQEGVFTLVERSSGGDRFQHIASITEALPASRHATFIDRIASPATSAITLTVTEAGYSVGADGRPDLAAPRLRNDIEALRNAQRPGEWLPVAAPVTVLGKLIAGLDERRRKSGAGIALVPCDNIPDNGGVLRDAVHQLSDEVGAKLSGWVTANVSFVATSVDRITPRVEPSLLTDVTDATGFRDLVPVAAEPFSDWVLAGDFPTGRPAWETAGALFVADVEPYERRKLWLLNGAHSIFASLGTLRRHRTVAEAIADRACAGAVESWWDLASRHLPHTLELDAYRRDLRKRFANTRIEHSLTQISTDALMKTSLRILPATRLELARGGTAESSAAAIAAWICVTLQRPPESNSRTEYIADALRSPAPPVALLSTLASDLARNADFCGKVLAHVRALSSLT